MKISKITVALVCVICMVSAVAFARGTQERSPQSDTFEVQVHDGGPMFVGPQGEGTFTFVSAEMSFDGKVVKGAPFSAQTVSEHIQVMADGNRIVNNSSGSIYRDSEGRMRREQQIGAIGGFTAEKAPTQMISIHDPVAGTNFTLNVEKKVAIKHGTFKVQLRHDGESGTATSSGTAAGTSVTITDEQGGRRVQMAVPPPPPDGPGRIRRGEGKTESLGKQVIEGVEAEGTRTTHTIPAGAMGNEQPINIVSERWYSPDLQTVVMSKHSDPRFGESTFRLTNINRSEPAAALFQVPSDYTVQEGGRGFNVIQDRAPRRQAHDQ